MTIIRVERRERFTTLDNETVRDSRLTWKARGLLTYLLSKPDDWRTNSRQLANESPDGRHAVLSGLKELERHGYITRQTTRTEQGRYVTETTVREISPTNLARLSDPGKPRPYRKTEDEKYQGNQKKRRGWQSARDGIAALRAEHGDDDDW